MGQFNDIIILGEDKSKNKDKGGGINAILTLMKDIGNFREAVVDCKEAQAMQENKDRIAQFEVHLDEMYEELLEMARTGWKSVRDQNAISQPLASEEAPVEAKPAEMKPVVKVPSAPRM